MRHVLVRVGIVAALAAIVAGLAVVGAARAGDDERERQPRRRPLLDLQRVAEPQRRRSARQRPVDPGQRPGEGGRGDHPAHPARRAADQRVRLRRRWDGRGCSRRTTSSMSPERRRRRSTTRTASSPPSNTGIPSGFDLNNNGVVGGPDDAFGFGFFPGQFGMAVYSQLPDPHRRGPHLPEVPLEGHAGRAPARRPRDAGAGRLVLARRARRLPPVVEEPLGRPDPDRRQGRPLPGEPSDAAGLRRPRGPQRHPQLRRDPLLGRLHHTRSRAPLHLRRRRRHRVASSAGALFVIAGDQNSDPLDGDSIPGSIQQLLEHPLVNAKRLRERRARSQQAALQGGANPTHRSDPRFDTADFADNAPGNLRADYVLPREEHADRRRGRVLAAQTRIRCSRWSGCSRFPSSDHRAVLDRRRAAVGQRLNAT